MYFALQNFVLLNGKQKAGIHQAVFSLFLFVEIFVKSVNLLLQLGVWSAKTSTKYKAAYVSYNCICLYICICVYSYVNTSKYIHSCVQLLTFITMC